MLRRDRGDRDRGFPDGPATPKAWASLTPQPTPPRYGVVKHPRSILAPNRGSSCLGSFALSFAALFLFASRAHAQVTVSQTSLTGYTVPTAITGGLMVDPTYDQQTGQGADDFVGDGTTGGNGGGPGPYYGFYKAHALIDFGQGAGAENALIFRFRFNLQAASWTGNVRLGVDGNNDGRVDLYFGVSSGAAQQPSIDFQNPTGTALDANTSPNTSALGNNYSTIAVNANDYAYFAAPDGSNYYTNKPAQGNPDQWLTFAVPFSTFAANLGARTGTVIDYDWTYLAFVAFTSTQGNAVNQDVYGIGAISTFGGTRYDQGGGFTTYESGSGRPIPEPATYLQFGALVAAGLLVRQLRRRTLGQRAAS